MKVIVEIDCKGHSIEDLTKDSFGWFPDKSHPELISIDRNYLQIDPEENSYFLFKFIEAKP